MERFPRKTSERRLRDESWHKFRFPSLISSVANYSHVPVKVIFDHVSVSWLTDDWLTLKAFAFHASKVKTKGFSRTKSSKVQFSNWLIQTNWSFGGLTVNNVIVIVINWNYILGFTPMDLKWLITWMYTSLLGKIMLFSNCSNLESVHQIFVFSFSPDVGVKKFT